MGMGRPRAFDADAALDRAMDVFWRHGYEGATIAQLTEAMNINPPSLYAAFGSKEGLLKAALDRYTEKRDAWMEGVLGAPTAREVAELCSRLHPEVLIPMHNDMFAGNRVNPADLVAELERVAPQQPFHFLHAGEIFLYCG